MFGSTQLVLYRCRNESDDAIVVSHRPSSRPPRDPAEVLLGALTTLREAERRDDPRWGATWGVVRDFIRTLRRAGYGLHGQQDDYEQETFIKVFRGVSDISADTPAMAAAWVRKIHHHVVIDAQRRHKKDPLGRRRNTDELVDPLERVPSPEQPQPLDPAIFEEERQRFFNAIEEWLELNVPNRRRRAERYGWCEDAWAVYVGKEEHAVVRERRRLSPSRDAFSQRLHRARENILLPVCEEQLGEIEPESTTHLFLTQLVEILLSYRRADAGTPRPHRRREEDDDDDD